jgi:hypothetical protein
MKTWARVRWPMRCGKCGDVIAVGAAVQLQQIAGLQRQLRRCVGCAGEAIPEDLPPMTAVKDPSRTTKARFRSLAQVGAGFDWKHRQAGD